MTLEHDTHDSLDAGTAADVLALADRLEREDGSPPLSDRARARVADSGLAHFVVRDGDAIVGYGQLDGGEFELAAEPGAAALILDELTPPFSVWSHGRGSRLVPVFEARGYSPTRELLQLRRPAKDALADDPPLPSGVEVRTFRPGTDEDAWLAVNAAAFADHPEQGRLTRDDLLARESESWFDPAGFLLAERDGTLLGFHWTKIHPDGAGEVYVLGISPDAQGSGLGSALLVRGLRYLSERDVPFVLLYVEGENDGAVRLYERHGFRRHDLDVQWSSG